MRQSSAQIKDTKTPGERTWEGVEGGAGGVKSFIYLPFIYVIYLLALQNTVCLDMQCSLRSDSLSLIP